MGQVRKILSEVFNSVVILPLTAGNMFGSNRDRPIHDGRISTVAIVGCLISIILAIIHVCVYDPTQKYIPFHAVKIILSTMVLIGLGTIIVLSVHYRKNNQSVTTRYTTEKRNQLKTKFLWLFGVTSNVYNGLSIWWFVECLTTHPNQQFTYIINILYCGLLIVFHFVQIVFICYFSSSGVRFIGSLTNHYGILFLLVANGSTWLLCFLQVSSTMFDINTLNSYDQRNSENHTYICIRNGSSFENFLTQTKPVLYSGFVAFPLLSVSMLISMWCSTENPTEPVAEEENFDESCYIELKNGVSGSETVSERNKIKFLRNHSMSYYATIVTGIALSLPYILGSLLLVNSKESSIYEIWQLYKLAFKILIWVFGLVAFYKLKSECRPNNRYKPLEANEIILFFSAFADAVFHTFGLLAAALILPNRDISESAAHVVLAENIMNLLVDYFQTVFIIQANRYEKKVRNNLNWPVENTCLLLCILNLGQWTIDNFTIYFYRNGTKLQSNFYNAWYWGRVMNFVFPVAVFFRFQSFMGMYILCHTFKNI